MLGLVVASPRRRYRIPKATSEIITVQHSTTDVEGAAGVTVPTLVLAPRHLPKGQS